MDTTRTFQLSSELFWGFRVKVDLAYVDDIATVIKMVKLELKGYLLQRNLQALAEKVDRLPLHMHEPNVTFDKLLEYTRPKEILYLCDHCDAAS
jgi:hypothetical protein